jgi:hypothetical protein
VKHDVAVSTEYQKVLLLYLLWDGFSFHLTRLISIAFISFLFCDKSLLKCQSQYVTGVCYDIDHGLRQVVAKVSVTVCDMSLLRCLSRSVTGCY